MYLEKGYKEQGWINGNPVMVGQAEALMHNCLQLENITKGFMDGRMYQEAD